MPRLRIATTLLLALASTAACKSSKSNPAAPSPVAHEQPPNEDGFEPLGTRHFLMDANGNPTKMWAELVEIKPLRGSKIVTGPFSQQPDCNLVCYSVVIRVGVDDPASRAGGFFISNFTIDRLGSSRPGEEAPGTSPRRSQVCAAITPTNGFAECKAGPGPGSGGSTIFTTFAFVPKYLHVYGEYRHSFPLTLTTGATNFEVNYQPK